MASLPQRKIGSDNVTAIGYGAMAIGGHAYGASGSDEDRFKILDHLLELGCTNIDTACIYKDSEELLGKWFARTPGTRGKIFLATKFGIDRGRKVRGDPAFVREQIAQSLKRLQTDHVDLFYQHRIDANTPIEVTVKAVAELIKEGKVRYLGLSEASPDTIRRAHKIHPVAAIQVEYSPLELALEEPGGVIEVARELGIAVIAYSPTAHGLATGRFRSFDELPEGDYRRTVPKYSAENFPRILKLVEELEAIGKAHNATSAQVAIAWLLAQGNDIIPIPGSKQIKYIEENLAAAHIKLSEDEIKAIRRVCDEANKKQVGERSAWMSVIYTETPPYDPSKQY